MVLGDEMTEIGAEAFKGCCSLTAVEVPESVRIIGRDAFAGCSSLVSAAVPKSAQLRPGAFDSHVTLVCDPG